MRHGSDEQLSVEEYLTRHQQKDMLRMLTCGSVDDGKSTLIGRLLHDTKLIYDDQLAGLHKDSERVGKAGVGEIDFALLCDGLKSEREQGITIDVAYRYFSTDQRTFIIADCPGHEQYTRNMATGASTCDLAVILIDARNGVITQTKRHSFIVGLLGLKHVVVAINKMDLMDYSQEVFDRIQREYTEFAARLDITDVHFVPVSALRGDNIVDASENMPWYRGAPLLSYLESVHIASDRNLVDMRLPVQYVIRPDTTYRGYAGTVASGVISVGKEVVVLPSGIRTQVSGIRCLRGPCEQARAGESVTITLANDIDCARGDMLAYPDNQPHVTRDFEAMLVWMNDQPLDPSKSYLVRTIGAEVPGQISTIRYRVDVNTLHRSDANELQLNDIARVHISCTRPVAIDPYRQNRITGAFILIDRSSNATVAAGMVRQALTGHQHEEPATHAADSLVSQADRSRVLGQQGGVIWLTGLPKAAKSLVAAELERQLIASGHACVVLDGSRLRQGLSDDLGFSADDRAEQTRRLAHVASITAEAGLISIVASVSPFAAKRAEARQIIGSEHFCEVHCSAPLDWCESHDDEGIYARARSGELHEVTGVSSPYEAPEQADVTLPTHELPAEVAAGRLQAWMDEQGWLRPAQ